MKSTHWQVRAAVLMALALVLTGCSGNDSDQGSGDSDVGTSTDKGCQPSQPIALQVVARNTAGTEHLDEVTACTSDQQYGPILLINDGDAVWRLFTDSPGPTSVEDSNIGTQAFRSDMESGGVMSTPVLIPGESVLVPGTPGQVSWQL